MRIHKISLEQLREIAPQRPMGYADDFLSSGRIEHGILLLDDNVYQELWKKYAPANKPHAPRPVIIEQGPGTELKKLIAKFGFKPKVGCKCNQHIAEMNRNGPDWCEQNMDLIAGWLREEADRAGYPFIEIAAKMMIKKAIKRARRQK